MLFGKILGILPNRVREGARSDILMDLFDEPESDSEIECGYLLLPGTEIPKSFNSTIRVLEIPYHSGLVENFLKWLSVLLFVQRRRIYTDNFMFMFPLMAVNRNSII